MRAESLVGVVFVAAVVFGCSNGNSPGSNTSCEYAGKCPKDPPRTSGEVATCASSLSDMACGGTYQALINCGAGAEQCSPDGTQNVQATFSASSTACHGARAAWVLCQRNELGLVDSGSVE